MKKKAFLFIIIAGLLWGSSGIFVKFISPLGFTSLQMTAVRGAISLLCMAAYVLISDRSLFLVKPAYLLLLAPIGVFLFSTASLYYTAMQMTSISTAVVLMYTSPIYVSVFSMLFLGEKRSPLKFAAILLLVVGCGLVSGIVGGFRFDPLGILLGFLSGLSYAAYNILTKIALKKGNNPISVSLYGFLFMVIVAIPFSSPTSLFENISASPSVALPLLIGLGICTFVLPYFLYTSAMKDLSAGTASAFSVVEPLAATVYSVVFFKEKLDVFGVVGIVTVLISVILIGLIENSGKQNS